MGISFAFLGSKVFPEQYIILCPKCAIKVFESLLKPVANECCHLSPVRGAKKGKALLAELADIVSAESEAQVVG
jgi:hypothetical protein